MEEYAGLVERKCKICQKVFMARPEYVYKRNPKKESMVYFCSWSCMRKYEAEHTRHKGRKVNEKAAEIVKLLEAGYTIKDIREQLGVTRSMVEYYRDNLIADQEDRAAGVIV